MVVVVVAVFEQKGKGAPGREPVISETEQKNMMAYYYKKQEEMKVFILLRLCLVNIFTKSCGYFKSVCIFRNWPSKKTTRT